MAKVTSIIDVVQKQLCTGCGICAAIEPNVFCMEDTYEYGKRPFVINNNIESGEAFLVCPGNSLIHDFSNITYSSINKDLLAGWGPIISVWEGYSVDSEIRYAGSSGGAATALALFALESKKVGSVIHTAAKQNSAYLNETVISKGRADLLNRTGSRYAPSSPCDELNNVNEIGKSVFIGKPCDVAAVNSAKKINVDIANNIDFTIAFFCAGVPSIEGNIKYLKKNGINNLSLLKKLKYRGNGWPGHWQAHYEDDNNQISSVEKTYAESWGYLQKYRQWRCYICPDHTGEFADISVGDPWYRETSPDEPGKSLIIARTQKGLEIIKAAEAAGYLALERNQSDLLPRSQPNLIATRGSLWARLIILRLLGAAVPRYIGFSLFRFWLKELTVMEKLRSIVGTTKRVYSKKLKRIIFPKKIEATDKL